jgi:hypothetical protein
MRKVEKINQRIKTKEAVQYVGQEKDPERDQSLPKGERS